jgi:hypothetical protein
MRNETLEKSSSETKEALTNRKRDREEVEDNEASGEL